MRDDLLRLWPRIEPLVDRLIDLSPDEQGRCLAEVCGGDAEIERAVAEVLAGARDSGDFLAAGPPLPAGDDTRAGGAPDRIGAFQVIRELGRGGMGTVVLAERADGQFEQRVAIKLVDAGGRSDPSTRAFLREREILGRLEHPHIARIYDAGVTAEGVLYFVMEHVDGVPIDEFCSARGLGIDARLGLFRQVCAAVEYAHGRLVVHRDIKPSNVLVTSDGSVKLLDFGIAERLDEAVSGDVALLDPDAPSRGLTPAYAAPEQLRGEAVTSATDVYQLGLLLFELLTGTRRRRLTPGAPLSPSRAAAEETWARRLAGDLDAIVDRALRDAPEERYPSVEALRRDIDDFLASRPVSARRGTPAHRLGLFVRRHRVGVAAASAAVLSLTVALIAVTAQSVAVATERDKARAAEAKAGAVNEFLVQELLRAPMPEEALGRTPSVREVLDKAARSVGTAFGAQPALEAGVRDALARSYLALGRLGEAETHAAAAERLAASTAGASSTDAQRERRLLAELALERGRIEDARKDLEALHAEQAASRGADDRETLETAALAGRALVAAGETAAAERLLGGARAAARSRYPDDWRLELSLERELVGALLSRSAPKSAETLCREMLDVERSRLGPDHPEVLSSMEQLATALRQGLKSTEAVAVEEEVLAVTRRIYGAEHPATARALMHLAVAYDRIDRDQDSERALDEAYDVFRKTLGPEHPKTVIALLDKAIGLRRAGKSAEAEPIYRAVVEIRARTLGERHPDTIEALTYLGILLAETGRLGEAREVAHRTIAAYEGLVAGPQPDPAHLADFADYLLQADPADVRDPARALPLAERAVEATGRRSFGALRVLGAAQREIGRSREAIATLREAIVLPDGLQSWTTEEAIVDLLRETDPAAITPFLTERAELLRARRGPEDRLVGKTLRILAQNAERDGRAADAERYFREAVAQLRKTQPDDYWEVARAKSELAECLMKRGSNAEAATLLREAERVQMASRRGGKDLAETRRRLLTLHGGDPAR